MRIEQPETGGLFASGDVPLPKRAIDAENRGAILAAYADELTENPPVRMTNPAEVGEAQARKNALKLARKDVDRFFAAAKRAGLRVVLEVDNE